MSTPGVCGDWLDLGAPCSAVGLAGCPASSQTCQAGVCRAIDATLARPVGLGESCAERPCQDGLGCDERMRCGWRLASLGDCGRERAMLCEPGLVCTATGTDTFERPGQCLPPEVPACFVATSS